MKKFILAMTLMAIMALPVYATDYPMFNGYLLSGVTTTNVAGTIQGFASGGPVSKHLCTATMGGTVPTSMTFVVQCSGDGTHFGNCAEETVTSSPTVFHIDKPAILYIRG